MKNKQNVNPLLHALLPIVITIAYILIGFVFDSGWAIGWILFLLIPIIETLVNAIKNKNPSNFAYPVFVTAIFLFTGMMWGLWHPMWVLFVTIPAYYAVCDAIKKSKPQPAPQQSNEYAQENSNNQAEQNQQGTYYNPPVNVSYQQSKNGSTAVIITIIVAIAVVACVAIFSVFAWLGGGFNTHDVIGSKSDVNSQSFAKGPYDIATDGIESIDIEWVNGNINVESYNGDTIYIEESSSNQKYPMTYKIDNKTLEIEEYSNSLSASVVGRVKKDLTVKIPEDFVTDVFSLDIVSAQVNISNLNTLGFDLECVSGNTRVSFAKQPQRIDADSVSGNIYITLPSDVSGFSIAKDSISGNLDTSDFGNVTRYGDGYTLIDIESVSGNIYVEKNSAE